MEVLEELRDHLPHVLDLGPMDLRGQRPPVHVAREVGVHAHDAGLVVRPLEDIGLVDVVVQGLDLDSVHDGAQEVGHDARVLALVLVQQRRQSQTLLLVIHLETEY